MNNVVAKAVLRLLQHLKRPDLTNLMSSSQMQTAQRLTIHLERERAI